MNETLLGEKIKEAMVKKQQDVNTFVWKGSKELDSNGKYKQSEKKLVSMSEFELNECYDHCKTMLFNENPQNPGRYGVLTIIADQKDRIGAELFLRYVEQNTTLTRFTLMESINEFLKNNREAFKNYKVLVEHVVNNTPPEFAKIPLSIVMDACLDRLGTFNKKHITRTFILKQGIWLTLQESKDLIEYDSNGSIKNKLDVIRERLNIKDVEKLYLNSKGLNYTQMRAMLNIKPNKKFIDLTTSQLETLRYRILFNLEETVKEHINAWETRMAQIEQVVEHLKFKLYA